MATIKERINSASDSYYVSAKGYKKARRRLHDDKVNHMGNVLSLIIGGVLFVFGVGTGITGMWVIGLIVFVFGIFMNWMTARNRKYRESRG